VDYDVLYIRKVWRYQRHNQKPKKGRKHNDQKKKDKQWSTKHYTETQRLSNANLTKYWEWTLLLRKS